MIVRLGDDPVCSPTFVGPLTPEQSLICNLEAGIGYRDDLLSQASSPGAPVAAGFGSSPLLIWAVVAVLAIALLKK